MRQLPLLTEMRLKKIGQKEGDKPGHDVDKFSVGSVRYVGSVFHLTYVTQSYIRPPEPCQRIPYDSRVRLSLTGRHY